jgi:outer membrane protein assembly factor BamD (BamD/ComL family)
METREVAAPPEGTNERAPSPPQKGSSSSDDSWARERAMLDGARRNLAEGNARASLVKLQRYTAEFPRGRLSEECEALLVNALVRSQQYDEARRRADAFRRRYPRSFLAPSVDAAIEAIP